MKLINPSFEIWEQGATLEDMWAHIARCTRVCYQSEKKDDKESEEEFVKRVILRHEPWSSDKNHLAMLEHGTVYLYHKTWNNSPLEKYKKNKYSKYDDVYLGKEVCQGDVDYHLEYFVTTNLRVLVENDWLDDLKYLCTPTEHHVRRVTVSFITNIGVTREFNRHRVNSIAEESTRYCNYNKRNDGQINIALPAWLNWNEQNISFGDFEKSGSGSEDSKVYIEALLHAEEAYNKLIKLGWKPQQAREVLPLATKTQLIHTAFVDDWKHFFALRADGVSGPPHPNASLLAKPLKEEFIKRGYI